MRAKHVTRISTLASSATIAMALSGLSPSVNAADFNFGNPDISMQWGNTVRYNVGVRLEKPDNTIARSPNTDEGDNAFDRNEIVTNRLDLLSEIDFTYKGQYGFRLSGSAWRDFAFNDEVQTGPGLENRGSYINNRFSDTTKRYHKGASGELLDAYVFSNFAIDEMQGNVKVGRQSILWGEALVLSQHSVSYAQQPTDGLKALTSPGVDAKELVLPVGQIHTILQVNDKLTLAAQYFFEWEPTRLAQGGTYLAGTDFLLDGPDQFSLAPGVNLRNEGIEKPDGHDDWGVNARYYFDAIDSTVGAYYRVFDEVSPTVSLNPAAGTYRTIYPENTKLYGLSLSKLIGGVSVGSELVYRDNTALVSSIADGADEGARGNTVHALLNGVKQVGQTALWTSATFTGEVAYSYLDKINSGERYFNGCKRKGLPDRDEETGCASRDAWIGTVRFSPSWVGVAPGWDVSATASVTVGLDGNSPVLGGGNEKAGSYTVGTTFTYNSQHDFSIAYIDYLGTYEKNPVTGTILASNGSQLQDRGWLALSYKGQF